MATDWWSAVHTSENAEIYWAFRALLRFADARNAVTGKR
jgi:hypothetical protein